MDKDTAFIVMSPFQALCSINVIKQKGIKDATIFLIDGIGSFEKTKMLLGLYKRDYIFVDRTLPWYSLIKYIKSFGRFRNVYIGDYFSIKEYIIAMAASVFNGNAVYMDDGNSTLSIAPPVSRKRYYSVKNRIAWLLFGLCGRLKRLHYAFCTIYDIKGISDYPIIKNDLSRLIGSESNTPGTGLYIIGTNVGDLKLKSYTYEDYLKWVIDYLKVKDDNETIYYCPHRKDPESHSEILDSNNVKMFDTEISVEVDFCSKGINPAVIIGFGSTALVTLKSIFPYSEVFNCTIIFEDEELNRTYKSIEDYMAEHHIPTLQKN